jgi:hypothetical protein
VQTLTISGETPIRIQVKLGSSRAVAVGSDVMADVFKMTFEEVTLWEFQGHLVLDEYLTDAVKVVQKGRKIAGKQKDVVNDYTATFVGTIGIQGVKQGVPFILHLPHHRCKWLVHFLGQTA